MRKILLTTTLLILAMGSWCAVQAGTPEKIKIYSEAQKGYIFVEKVVLSEAEWRARLTPEQFKILRQKGNEAAYSGPYCNQHASGIYQCAGCGTDLFSSSAKFIAGTGWPSFWQPISAANINTYVDKNSGQFRTEVHCSRCGGHLGQVHNDGPKPTGKRYSINAAALKFMSK